MSHCQCHPLDDDTAQQKAASTARHRHNTYTHHTNNKQLGQLSLHPSGVDKRVVGLFTGRVLDGAIW